MATEGAERLLLTFGWILIPALLWIAWRLYRSRHLSSARAKGVSAVANLHRPGADSEFYLVEQRLGKLGWTRRDDETPAAWLARLRAGLPRDLDGDTLTRIAGLHYHYRFDPAGLPLT